MIATISFILLLMLLHAARGDVNLAVIEAGLRSSKAQVLSNGFSVCPTDFSPRGISIRCQGLDIQPPVIFKVNGRTVKREFFVPYTISGDFLGRSNPWNVLYGFVTLTCTTRKWGAKVTVSGSFRCNLKKQLYYSNSSLIYPNLRMISVSGDNNNVRSRRRYTKED